MTDEEQEVYELRYHCQNLKEELELTKAECLQFEKMYLDLGAHYEKIKQQKEFLWNEYMTIRARLED